MFGWKKESKKKISPTAAELKNFNQDSLYVLFTEDRWNAMDDNSRLAVLQEVENRQAAAYGRRPYKIRIGSKEEFSSPGLCGYCSAYLKEIHLNYRYFSGVPYFYGGPSALETLIHEGRHAYQHFCTENGISDNSPDILKEWLSSSARYFNGGAIYALQAIEEDARRFARREMQKIMNNLLLRGIEDRNFILQYQDQLQTEDYFIREAREHLTIKDLDDYENLILNDMKKRYPNLDIRDLHLFDSARLILQAKLDTTDDLIRLLDKLDQIADKKLDQIREKKLNYIQDMNKLG